MRKVSIFSRAALVRTFAMFTLAGCLYTTQASAQIIIIVEDMLYLTQGVQTESLEQMQGIELNYVNKDHVSRQMFSFYLYPNHVTDRLYVNVEKISDVTGMEIINSDGAIIFNASVSEGSIYVPNLGSGSYTLCLSSTEGNFCENFSVE